METSCTYTDKDRMYLSTDERRLITRILRFREKYPDDVTILKHPEENDGCLYCIVPPSWLKVTPPAKREMTEEQRQAMMERMANMRDKRTGIALDLGDADCEDDAEGLPTAGEPTRMLHPCM